MYLKILNIIPLLSTFLSLVKVAALLGRGVCVSWHQGRVAVLRLVELVPQDWPNPSTCNA